MDPIVIRGARQHNLKSIDLTLPRNSFIVFTGVSGSGKSSLAFDTLFAEGQRRYIEALSAQSRLFLPRLEAPEVDEIRGLSPAIAIEQKGMVRNPRSTVGTLTEIHDRLRLLFAKLGTVHCPFCSIPVRAYTIPQIVDEIFTDWPLGNRLLLLAPLGTIPEREISALLKKLRRDGFARVRANGTVYELDPPPLIPRRATHEIEIVVDRLVLQEKIRNRLTESIELALKHGKGKVRAVSPGEPEKLFSDSYECATCGRSVAKPTLSLFSFHHPSGMCMRCKGLGVITEAGNDESKSRIEDKTQDSESLAAYDETSHSEFIEEGVECPECHGARLNVIARSVRLSGLGIHEVSALSIPHVRKWAASLKLNPSEAQIARRPIDEIDLRLRNLEELGLPYLTLDRSASSLSGGEAQRVRLSTQVSMPLSGVLYVLDEPSIGLHPRDHQRLLGVLTRLRDAGNTLVVVEHDRDTILQADHVVDIGPGAGANGGHILFSGSPSALLLSNDSVTGPYLSGRKSVSRPAARRSPKRGSLRVIGASGHNLKKIDVELPLGCLVCLTGVSGSGKSTLLLRTVYRALARDLHGARALPAPYERLENYESIKRVVLVDQDPIGRTPRSTPATYSGIFDHIRRIYSQIPEARARGYSPSRFSFNARGGRCEACRGEGLERIEMFFLPDIYVTCPACGGSRYGTQVLEILFKGHSIADVLGMTFQEAAAIFENFPSLNHKISTMLEVGLGYLKIGQPAHTLSGGEAQRVKLGTELGRKVHGSALYVLDEPTTGLHFEDIQKLLHVLQRLVDQGHTVALIEHHPDIIKSADYVIDLGPAGGDEGGYVVAAGTPEQVTSVSESHTGRYLRDLIASS